MEREDIWNAFAAFCGPAKYTKFLRALRGPGYRVTGVRLRYWQELLWAEFAGEHPEVASLDASAVAALFADAPVPDATATPEPPPVMPSKQQFLADPLGHRLPDEVPVEWVREGWLDAAFRDAVVSDLARSVSKVGGFGLACPCWLATLPTALAPAQVVDLYHRIRNDSQRLELEWRPTFMAAFHTVALPESQDVEVVVGGLRSMIESGSGQGFEDLVEVLLELPVASEQLDPNNPNSLLALAVGRGRRAMVSILRNAGRELADRQGP